MLKYIVGINRVVSSWIDAVLPAQMSVGGAKYYRDEVIPGLMRDDLTVYDLGGGSQPYISVSEKQARRLKVVGLDIDIEELKQAPEGAYDRLIAEDLSRYQGDEDGDLVICQATLEHVKDTTGAIRAISSTMQSGALAVIFVPCRNAIFARLNLILPERFKQWMLGALYEEKGHGHDGFEAFYDKCTPDELIKLARNNGLEFQSLSTHWKSSYFSFFFPLYALWRVWTLFAKYVLGKQFCENFVLVLKKK